MASTAVPSDSDSDGKSPLFSALLGSVLVDDELADDLVDANAILRNVGFVMLVPALLQSLVCALFRPERHGPGGVVIEQGGASNALYVVSHGELEVVRQTDSGEVALDRLGPGAVFGEVGLLTRSERMATVRAIGPAEVLRLGRDGFEALLQVHPEVADALAGQVRLSQINTLLRGHPAFAMLPNDVLVASLAGFEPRELATGETIEDRDGTDDALYLVESGRLRIVEGAAGASAPPSGRSELRRGDFFGEDAVLAGTSRVERVEALEPTRLFRLGVAAFADLVQRDEAFAQAMLQRAQRRGELAADTSGPPSRGSIEIDQRQREQAAAEITQSEFFQALSARAENLRARLRGG